MELKEGDVVEWCGERGQIDFMYEVPDPRYGKGVRVLVFPKYGDNITTAKFQDWPLEECSLVVRSDQREEEETDKQPDSETDALYPELLYNSMRMIEESSELQLAICKAFRFGWYNWKPGGRQRVSNVDQVKHEMKDVIERTREMDKTLDKMKEQFKNYGYLI